jgi:hypothetical protein
MAERTLHSLWFPEKGEDRLRPELVRGSLKVAKGEGGLLIASFRFLHNKHYHTAEGSSADSATAVERAIEHAEALYQASLEKED